MQTISHHFLLKVFFVYFLKNALFQTLYINNKELFKYLLSLNKINLKEKNHKEESLYHIILNKGFDLFSNISLIYV